MKKLLFLVAIFSFCFFGFTKIVFGDISWREIGKVEKNSDFAVRGPFVIFVDETTPNIFKILNSEHNIVSFIKFEEDKSSFLFKSPYMMWLGEMESECITTYLRDDKLDLICLPKMVGGLRCYDNMRSEGFSKEKAVNMCGGSGIFRNESDLYSAIMLAQSYYDKYKAGKPPQSWYQEKPEQLPSQGEPEPQYQEKPEQLPSQKKPEIPVHHERNQQTPQCYLEIANETAEHWDVLVGGSKIGVLNPHSTMQYSCSCLAVNVELHSNFPNFRTMQKAFYPNERSGNKYYWRLYYREQ